MRPGRPAARHAVRHTLVKLLIGLGCFDPPRPFATRRKNTGARHQSGTVEKGLTGLAPRRHSLTAYTAVS